MQEVIAAIPEGVEVKMSLTKEEKILRDLGGFCPVRGSELRKICRTYNDVQGADADMVSIKNVDVARIEHYPLDGDGSDSEEEDDV